MASEGTARDLSRTAHDRILGAYATPKMLVATKLDATSDRLHRGASADLRHHYWIIRSDDPDKVRDADVGIDFAQVVDVGGARLTDEPFARDLLTTKLLVVEAMRGQYVSSASAYRIRDWMRYFAWIVRWRQGLRIQNMRSLTLPLFENFCERLKAGLIHLVPVEERVVRLEQRLCDGEYAWPRNARGNLEIGAVAAELGLSRTILVSSWAYARVRGLVERTAPELAGSLLEERPDSEGASAGDEDTTSRPSHQHVMQILLPWTKLESLSSLGLLPHDPLTFDPFKEVSLYHRVQQVAREPREGEGRTATPTPERWLSLLDGAARWMLDYSTPVMAICTQASQKWVEYVVEGTGDASARRDRFKQEVQALIDAHLPAGRPGVPRLLPLWAAGRGPKGMALEEALSHVATACFVLIAGFSARRKRELDSLRAGCAYQDPFGNWWLSSYIQKTVRDLAQIPIPSSVGVAAGILEELSQTARERTGEPWLGKIHRPLALIDLDRSAKPFLPAGFDGNLRSFAEMLGLSGAGDQDNPSFLPHQLRRSFSIYYYHGNRFSSLDALSRFLQHFDPEMTRRYITEAVAGVLAELREIIDARARLEVGEEIGNEAEFAVDDMASLADEHEAVRQEAFVGRALEVYDGIESPIGRGAPALRAELERLTEAALESVRITRRGNGSPDEVRTTLVRLLREHARNRFLEPHPHKANHCGCNPNSPADLETAVCLQNKAQDTLQKGHQPDYAFSSTEDCYRCSHCVAFSENVRAMEHKVKQAAEAAQKAPSEKTRVAAQDKYARWKAQLESARLAAQGSLRA